MRKITFFFIGSLALAALTNLASCDKSTETPPLPPGTGTDVEFTVSFNKWVYFSFSSGEIVGEGIFDNTATPPKDDDTWKNRTDWDIAFHLTEVRTNSGASTDNAQGGAYDTGKTDFDAVTTVPADAVFTVDEAAEIYSYMGAPGPKKATCGISKTINWAEIIAMPEISVSPNIYIVKTSDGKYAKIHLRQMSVISGTATASATIEFYYQPDGSTNLATEQTE
jgi:hypothetical protein